jgi:hypothetical protein
MILPLSRHPKPMPPFRTQVPTPPLAFLCTELADRPQGNYRARAGRGGEGWDISEDQVVRFRRSKDD